MFVPPNKAERHAAGDPFATNPRRWPGLNLLGFVLMRIREELRTPQG